MTKCAVSCGKAIQIDEMITFLTILCAMFPFKSKFLEQIFVCCISLIILSATFGNGRLRGLNSLIFFTRVLSCKSYSILGKSYDLFFLSTLLCSSVLNFIRPFKYRSQFFTSTALFKVYHFLYKSNLTLSIYNISNQHISIIMF